MSLQVAANLCFDVLFKIARSPPSFMGRSRKLPFSAKFYGTIAKTAIRPQVLWDGCENARSPPGFMGQSRKLPFSAKFYGTIAKTAVRPQVLWDGYKGFFRRPWARDRFKTACRNRLVALWLTRFQPNVYVWTF
jgi:hypothetical protein